jgi:hypothetical protein
MAGAVGKSSGVTDIADRLRCDNVRINLKQPIPRLCGPVEVHAGHVSIIGYGPSLRDTWHSIPLGEVITTSGAHDYLIDRGITPTGHVEFDPRAHKAKHINSPRVLVPYYIASCAHPDLFNVLAGYQVLMWHAKQGGEHDALIEKLEPGAHLIRGGASAGLRAIEVMYCLGFREFHIFGMDGSFDGSDGQVQWAGPHAGQSRFKRDVVEAECGGRKFKTSIAFWLYTKQFLQCRAALPDAKFTLYGDGLLQTAAALKKEMAA